MLVKLKPAKSSSPPIELFCAPPLAMLLTEPRLWCWVACDFGAEAYRERIDCFRSGLDWPGIPELGAALDGLAGAG